MKLVLSIILIAFGALMLSGLTIMALSMPPESMTWWEWKWKAVTFFVPFGGIPILIGMLLRPPGKRLQSVGIALTVTTVFCVLLAYVFIAIFGMNEELKRVDPTFDSGFYDYVFCFVVIAVFGALGGGCLLAARNSRKDEAPE